MIPDEVVERVREEADIVQVVGEFVKLKRSGNSYRGPCPFHQGTHDNFAVTPRGGYICFVCGEKGDVFTFVQKRLGLDFVESVKWVGARAGVAVEEVRRSEQRGPDPREALWEVNAAAAEYFQQQLGDERVGAAARAYLKGRNIGMPEAKRFTLGWAPREIGLMRAYLQSLGYDDDRQLAAGLLVRREAGEEPRPRFRERLIFPIYDVQGRVVGFGGRLLGDGEPKYLNSAESDVFSKRKLLYGLNTAKHAIRKADRLLVVEGYFDAIRVALSGVEEVVAPLGTALTEAQAALIRKYTKNVFLLYDSDAAGQKATFRAGDELLRNGLSVRVISLPEGDDPDTFVLKEGAAGLERAIEDSVDVFDRKVQILERGGWFADLRRKREALDKLLPTIRATADRLLRDLYVGRTAEVAGVSRELLQAELESGGDARAARPSHQPPDEPPPFMDDDGPPVTEAEPAPVRRRERRRDHRDPAVRAERELVRTLLHVRRLVEPTGERVGGESFTDPVYRAIFTELIASPDAPADELARPLDEEAVRDLDTLLEDRGGIDRADELVIDSINAIERRDIDAQLAQIDRQMPIASEEEKDELIHRKRWLVNRMNELGRPTRWKAFRRTSH